MKWENKGHEFDSIGYLLQDKKNIFLYGVGETTRELVELLHSLKKWVDWNIFLVDRDVVKQQEGRWGYDVLSPEQFYSMEKEQYFVIASADGKAGDEIYALVRKNLGDEVVLFKGFYFLYTYLPIYFAYVHDMVFFVSENMLPSTICNLNCRDCLNFTPYIQKHTVETLDDLKMSVDLFFGAVDLVYRFQITGGEPLLYKDLIPLIEYIDRNYRNKIIRFEMVTNGTIIPTDDICNTLKNKDIYVFLDDYRMSLEDGDKKYKAVYEQITKYGIRFVDNHVDKWIRMYIPEEDKRIRISDAELENKYTICNNPWSCLKQGKISSCNYAMYADKAEICKMQEDECFDLRDYNPSRKKELIEFRLRYLQKGYVEFCNQCGGWTATNKRWCQPAIQSER